MPTDLKNLPCPFCGQRIEARYDEDMVVMRGHTKTCVINMIETSSNGWIGDTAEERFWERWNTRART